MVLISLFKVMIFCEHSYLTMAFLDVVSLLVVFSLPLINQTEAVPSNGENVTADGNITHLSSNNNRESNNYTIPLTRVNTTKETQNHTDSNTASRNQHKLDKRKNNYGTAFNSILKTLALEHGMKVENLDILLQRLGVKDCSRHSRHNHKVSAISETKHNLYKPLNDCFHASIFFVRFNCWMLQFRPSS